MKRILWNSPRIPEQSINQEEFPWNVLFEMTELHSTDTPSRSDVRAVFHRYNESNQAERDAMDAVFVWFTGYSLATIAAKVAAGKSGDYEELLDRWRQQD